MASSAIGEFKKANKVGWGLVEGILEFLTQKGISIGINSRISDGGKNGNITVFWVNLVPHISLPTHLFNIYHWDNILTLYTDAIKARSATLARYLGEHLNSLGQLLKSQGIVN